MRKKIEHLVQKLVQTESTLGKCIHAAVVMKDFLEEHGFNVDLDNYKEGEANVLTSLGPSKAQKIVLSGHMDTVPIGDPDKWTHHPFSGTIVDNELWGRGSVDMKGGVGAITGALLELKEHESDLNYQVVLALSAEEETGLHGAGRFHEQGIMEGASHLLIAEPTDNIPNVMEKGIMWLEVSATGKQAHGSRPDLGSNAIEGLMEVTPSLYSVLPELSLPEVGKTSLNVGIITGGSAANVVPESASLILDIRTTPGVDNNQVITDMKNLLKEKSRENMTYDLEVVENSPSVATADNNVFANILAEETALFTGSKPPISGTYYATDGAKLLEGKSIAFCIYGPGSTELLHQTNERLDLKQLDESRQIIRKSVLRVNQM